MKNTSSCQLYLLPCPPTTPPHQLLTKLMTLTIHHHQYLHPRHLHHNHYRHLLNPSTLHLLLLALHHLHLIHHAHHHHHHINITNLQPPLHNQFGVNLTYTTHHTTTIHRHTPHQLHLVLHLLHLHNLLWWAHHLHLRAALLTYSTHPSLVHQTRRANPLHLRTSLLLLLQNHLLNPFLLLLHRRQHRLSQPCQRDRSRGCSAVLSSAWPE